MTLSSFEHSATGRGPTLLASLFAFVRGLGARMIGAWRQHRANRAFGALSYETLKDIGFPSSTAVKTGKPAR